MKKGEYQLYGFEFHAEHLKCSLEVSEPRLEVKLFHGSPVVLKANPPPSGTPSLKVHPSYLSPDELPQLLQDRSESFPPFSLDLRSFSKLEKESENAWEGGSEEGENTTDKSWKKVMLEKDGAGEQEGGGAGRSGEEGMMSKRSKEEMRRSLRMFPEDPTGQPYYKVRKGGAGEKEEADVGGWEVTRMPEAPKAETEAKSPEAPQLSPTEEPTALPAAAGPPEVQEAPKAEEEQPMSGSEGGIATTGDVCKTDNDTVHASSTELFDAGVTFLLGMEPLTMIHNLQRLPLEVRVCSEDGKRSARGRLELWPLSEAVLRAERGPPTPVVSAVSLKLRAEGDFSVTIAAAVRLYAFGKTVIQTIISSDPNPNEKMNHKRVDDSPEYREYNLDRGPSNPAAYLTDPLDNYANEYLGQPEDLVVDYPPEKKAQRVFFEEDLVFYPNKRETAPKPSDTYEVMRWKLNKMLGLREVRTEEKKEEEGKTKSKDLDSQESLLEEWKQRKKEELLGEALQCRKKNNETRNILRKILQGMNEPGKIPIEEKSIPILHELDVKEVEIPLPVVKEKKAKGKKKGKKDKKKGKKEKKKGKDKKKGKGKGKKKKGKKKGKSKSKELVKKQSKEVVESKVEVKLDKEKDEYELNTAGMLYEDIKKRQQEEVMIKHYKRLFRKMLRRLESGQGVSGEEVKRREKRRRTMKDLLEALEGYGAEAVGAAYLEVLQGFDTPRDWDPDSWPELSEPEQSPATQEIDTPPESEQY